MAPHAICERIRIWHPDGEQQPNWSNEEVAEMKKQSPLFERQILRLMQDPSYEWNITPEKSDGCHEIEDLGRFIAQLKGMPVDEMEVNQLSSRCSAIWYFEVVPSRLHLTSHSNTAAVPADTTSDGSAADSGREPSAWCWNDHGEHGSPETSLKWANIALVLGWPEVFKREIRTVIWGWPGQTLVDTNTPVQYLQKEGAKGLNRRREQELALLRGWVDEHFTKDPKVPQRVKDKIQKNDLDQFANQNPYSWMSSLEHTLLPSTKSMRRRSGWSQHTRGDHHRCGAPSTPSISQAVKGMTGQWAVKDEEMVKEKLTKAHKYIEERQALVAAKLLAWRERQVGRWQRVLEETTPRPTLNGGVGPAAGAPSSPDEQPAQP